MAVFANCKPADVFHYFEEICKIPHGSHNEKGISDYIRNWALGLGLEVFQDNLHNIIIKKLGTTGYEAAPAVILQGHLDMVCEKNADVEFDFEKDALDIYVDGDFVKARGTTLGADNGIAVAMCMAILASKDLLHPPLEIVLTSCEEAGMDGAKGIDVSLLSAKNFINVDLGEEGIFLSSCAGGGKVMVTLDLKFAELPAGDYRPYKLFVGGLAGGHSGIDIDKERGNSNKVLARILDTIRTPYYLNLLDGGSKDNAIPREAYAIIYVDRENVDKLRKEVDEIEKVIKTELQHSDAEVFARLHDAVASDKVFADDAKKRAIELLLALPHGVDHMSAALPGLVETSNNMGVVKTEGDRLKITNAVRSSSESRKWALCRRISIIAAAFGAQYELSEGYSGWQYNPISPLRDMFVETWTRKFGKAPEVVAMHAGVECGIFADKMPGLDMVAIGPDMFGIHTPEEKLSISSTAKVYDFLLSVLKSLK